MEQSNYDLKKSTFSQLMDKKQENKQLMRSIISEYEIKSIYTSVVAYNNEKEKQKRQVILDFLSNVVYVYDKKISLLSSKQDVASFIELMNCESEAIKYKPFYFFYSKFKVSPFNSKYGYAYIACLQRLPLRFLRSNQEPILNHFVGFSKELEGVKHSAYSTYGSIEVLFDALEQLSKCLILSDIDKLETEVKQKLYDTLRKYYFKLWKKGIKQLGEVKASKQKSETDLISHSNFPIFAAVARITQNILQIKSEESFLYKLFAREFKLQKLKFKLFKPFGKVLTGDFTGGLESVKELGKDALDVVHIKAIELSWYGIIDNLNSLLVNFSVDRLDEQVLKEMKAIPDKKGIFLHNQGTLLAGLESAWQQIDKIKLIQGGGKAYAYYSYTIILIKILTATKLDNKAKDSVWLYLNKVYNKFADNSLTKNLKNGRLYKRATKYGRLLIIDKLLNICQDKDADKVLSENATKFIKAALEQEVKLDSKANFFIKYYKTDKLGELIASRNYSAIDYNLQAPQLADSLFAASFDYYFEGYDDKQKPNLKTCDDDKRIPEIKLFQRDDKSLDNLYKLT